MPLPRNIVTATEADILSLVEERAAESAYLDLKRDLPGADNAAKHEFVADISALANGGGGDVVYGVDEDKAGVASAVCPWSDNPDQTVRRLQDILLHSVEPRLPGVQVQAVPVSGGHVLVVRVPRSWAGPHRVKTNQHFFIREGARKRQLDVPEIRSLFLHSADQGRRVRDFRTDRLGALMSGQAPARLVEGPVLVVHFIPTESIVGELAVDPVAYVEGRYLPLLGASTTTARTNIDGALVARTAGAEGTHGYSLFFRNGYFEATKVLSSQREGGAVLPSGSYETELMSLLSKFREELRALGATGELVAMLSLIRADQVTFGVGRGVVDFDEGPPRFDRATLTLPDVLIPADRQPSDALRPIFDLVWQAAGLTHSFNYDGAGNWVGQRR